MAVVRWLFGFVQVLITGAQAQRLCSTGAAHGLVLWGIAPQGEQQMRVCIRASDYKKLCRLAKKWKLRLKICKKIGLPFAWKSFCKKRMLGMLAGIAGGIVLLCIFSTRIWVITVTGVPEILQQQVLAAAAEEGVFVGSAKSSFRPAYLEDVLMERFPALSWISVNDWGSTVEISVREGELPPQIFDPKQPAHVIARVGGRITRMEVLEGESKIQVGDGVVPGQLLVSGIWQSGETVRTLHASAKIMAETKRTFTVEIPLEREIRTPTGEVQERKSLWIFGIPVPLSGSGQPEGAYTKESRTDAVTILGTALPLSITTERYHLETVSKVPLTRAEAEQLCLEKLRQEQEKQLRDAAENGSVLQEQYRLTKRKNGWRLVAACLCEENIAQEWQFAAEEPEPVSSEEMAS